MTDFTTYKPPGTYIEEIVVPAVTSIGIQPTVIGLVGPSIGYRVATEAVVLSGTAASALGQTGINPTVGFSVAAADGTVYDPATYTVAVAAGADGNITTTIDNTTTLARNGATIPDGTTVYVTYRYTDADYATPLVVRDFDDVVTAFGAPFDAAGNIASPLSLAAQFAILNGASRLVLVPTSGLPTATTRAELAAAYTKLDAHPEVNVVVPLPVGITGTTAAPGDTANVGTDLKAQVEGSSANGVFRVGILGLDVGAAVDPATTLGSFKSKRVMEAWPNRMQFYSGASNATTDISGYYLAAAYAGRFGTLAPQMPLTKKAIYGFAGISPTVLATMSTVQKNIWSDAGVAVAEVNRAGVLNVRHGTTTDRSTAMTREMSLVRAKDSLVNLIQDTFDASDLVGGFIDGSTVDRVQGAMVSILEQASAAEIIVGYSNVKVRIRPGDPQVIEVKFLYQPAYPLNYINVSFSVDTTTGVTSLTLAA